MSCHHEHSHGGAGGHDHEHGHSHDDDVTPAIQDTLYSVIDFDGVVTMNETDSDSGMRVLKKTWDERLSTEPELVSDADQELLMHIPYVISLLYSCVSVYNLHHIQRPGRTV
ncbi:hypothetical protein Dda_4596 [Drechslerella dactyloides]|uniref:PITH domain-containing protein n=1 Tax=Drechslerella dactyloides TaxID=74499 RepID=A0AAD6IZF8_DREDA|nr:hypothetical protein Dda_4596 [Drechslerella dactyloides]